MTRYDEHTVARYIEFVKKERPNAKGMSDPWRQLEEEEDCKVVLDMLKCVAGNELKAANTKYVEFLLNTKANSNGH